MVNESKYIMNMNPNDYQKSAFINNLKRYIVNTELWIRKNESNTYKREKNCIERSRSKHKQSSAMPNANGFDPNSNHLHINGIFSCSADAGWQHSHQFSRRCPQWMWCWASGKCDPILYIYSNLLWSTCVSLCSLHIPRPLRGSKIGRYEFLDIQRRAHQSVRITVDAVWSIISRRAK